MKPRLLLFALLLACGVLQAQDTIRTLVITECRLDDARESYLEVTNVGETALDLSQFEVGIVGPWTSRKDANDLNKWFNVGSGFWFMLPEKTLDPGKSFLIASVYDWGSEMWAKDPVKYGTEVWNKREFWKIADIQLHFPESPNSDPADSITPTYHTLETWGGRECLYVRYHFMRDTGEVGNIGQVKDSVVIDQVNGIFTDSDGTRPDGPVNVAGVTNATSMATLVRKFTVKKGNLDFDAARGIDLEDSEWMPIPHLFGGWEMWRALFWTAGNHGDYNLDETTLTSSKAEVDWVNNTITVPWGTWRDDSVMFLFDKHPGLAWHYAWGGTKEDSSHYTARTGDVLTVYACGNNMDFIDFNIIVADPTPTANMIIPRMQPDEDGNYSSWPPSWVVTHNVPGMDSILRIPFGLRVDTLLKYMEKAPNATWEMEWLGGTPRTDVKTGDVLKVTSENGTVRRYYIKPDPFRKSHEARLASITWPDIPEDYRGLYGWIGDTVPNFSPDNFSYIVQVPLDVDGTPALVAKTYDLNAKLEVETAKNLAGPPADRTVKFTVTAQDDTSVYNYTVQLDKEKDLSNIQPWNGEPFISQFIWQDQWANGFMEVVNPGTEPLDMSNYMFCWGYVNTPNGAITRVSGTGDWNNRYGKYIPGYKWVDQATWATTPSRVVQDLNVNPIVQPGDVFVIGDIRGTGQSGYPWWASQQCDIDFGHTPWGETVNNWSALQQWNGANWYLFKIIGDSIKEGLKPANDPNDFELIDVFGSGTGDNKVIGGKAMEQINGFTRKPEIYRGNPVFNGSFGTNPATSEWIMVNRAYFSSRGIGWPNDILFICQGLGSHFMNEATYGKSTVLSSLYQVSLGYSMDETIKGLANGGTVDQFVANLYKLHPDQTLTVRNLSGDTLTGTDVIEEGFELLVLSGDQKSTTKYALTIGGLSNDAVLTAATYTVAHSGETGTISGFDYGTTIREVLNDVTVPAGARLTIVDKEGAWVSLQALTFDTTYVDVEVSENVFFKVIAEDNVTTIVYQLKPTMMNNGAFITSTVYVVDQVTALIDLVPEGATVAGLMKFITPAPGATVKLLDKFGFERTIGFVAIDDRIVVTSEDGSTTKTYYLQVLSEKVSYLAYVLSDVYVVDPFEYTIVGGSEIINDKVAVADFMANLSPAPGATMKLTDASDVEKTTGNMAFGDKLVVTAADGATVITYSVDVLSGITDRTKSVNVYPNPSAGMVYVSGLESGNSIVVTNMLGQRIQERTVRSSVEAVNLEGQRSGVYFITVNNGDQVVGRYKLILK